MHTCVCGCVCISARMHMYLCVSLCVHMPRPGGYRARAFTWKQRGAGCWGWQEAGEAPGAALLPGSSPDQILTSFSHPSWALHPILAMAGTKEGC